MINTLHDNRCFPPHGYRYMGGGGSSAQAIQSAPVPTPAAPATMTDKSVVQAEHDFAQRNMLKKSVKSTILAGDTGGYMPGGKSQPGAQAGYKAKLG
jgi:hypothetical protein